MDERFDAHDSRPRRDHAWALVLVGGLAADAVWLHSRPRRPTVEAHGPAAPADPASASPRELRTLPGIGDTRAIAIARERWRLPPGHSKTLSDVAGIGPVTEGGVRALLDQARLHDAGSGPPRSTVDSSDSSPNRRLGLVLPSIEFRAVRDAPASGPDRPP